MSLRSAALLSAVLAVPVLCGAQESATGRTSTTGDPLDGLERVAWSGWEDLAQLLDDVRANTGVPAIAAAFVRDGEIVAAATVGVQAAGSDVPVAATDRFHLGSLTKPFTAVVIAKLVEEGRLQWDTRVGDVLATMPMRADYRAVTLEQLLQHRGGLPGYTEGPPADAAPVTSVAGTPTEMRAAFLAGVLQTQPVAPPGETMHYSNAGYVLAGHMAEVVSGTSWEELVRRIVFVPLELETAGFGILAHPEGHVARGREYLPVPLDAYPRMEPIAPAGNVHCSVGDLARYARAHLLGLAGTDGFLRFATVQRLHTPPEGGTYASGWFVGTGEGGEPVHWHGGSVGASHAELRLFPAGRSAGMVLTTVESRVGEPLANRIIRAMRERYQPALAGFVSAGPRASEAENSARVVEEKADPAADARMWTLVRRLAEAINDEDRKAYDELFSPTAKQTRPDRDSMFDFMSENVLPSRGGIRSFHELRSAEMAPGMRIATFHLENGFPGYFGIILNSDGRIDQLSLFVKGDLCRSGTDPNCKAIVRRLGEDFE